MITEELWQEAEANQRRRENFRLRKTGVIRSALMVRPYIIAKVNGLWKLAVPNHGRK